MEAWNVTGAIKATDAGHVVVTPEGHDPLVEAYLRGRRGRRGAWTFLLGAGLVAVLGIGAGVALARRRR
jgi:hypothetical protein